MFRKSWLIGLVLILAACQSAAPSPTALPPATPTAVPTIPPSPTPAPPTPTPFPEEFSGEAQVGDHTMKISCEGTSPITMIYENGFDYSSWVGTSRLKKIGRSCYYSRVISPPPTTPRTSLDQVRDLHSLLQQTGVPGPYILVGHSQGGSNLVLFSDLYPNEVAGLVCVDCYYPTQEKYFLDILVRDSAGDPELAMRIPKTASYDDTAWKSNAERLDIAVSDEQYLKVKSLGDKLLIVLMAEDTVSVLKPSSDPTLRKLDKIRKDSWRLAAEDLARLSTQARTELVPGTDHLSILRNTALDKAIQEIFDKALKNIKP